MLHWICVKSICKHDAYVCVRLFFTRALLLDFYTFIYCLINLRSGKLWNWFISLSIATSLERERGCIFLIWSLWAEFVNILINNEKILRQPLAIKSNTFIRFLWPAIDRKKGTQIYVSFVCGTMEVVLVVDETISHQYFVHDWRQLCNWCTLQPLQNDQRSELMQC